MTHIALAAVLALAAGAALAQDRPSQDTPLLDYPQPVEGTDVFAVIEIPMGGSIKYEIDQDTGRIIVDRFISMPVAYPANYGSVPDTVNVDGDPLDVLVYTRQPVLTGAIMLVRPIGIMRMIDGGEQDDKVIAVPASEVDPTYHAIRTIADMPAVETERLRQFFETYKNLPDGTYVVSVPAFDDAEAAQALVAQAIAAGRNPQ